MRVRETNRRARRVAGAGEEVALYEAVLWAHGWLRWLVVVAGVGLIGHAWRARASARIWTPRDDRLARGFLAILDTQMLLGLLLWAALSPLSRAGLADLGTALDSAPLRFFTIEHPFGMLLGIVVAHAGLARSRRLEGPRRAAVVLVTLSVWLLVTLASVPWPPLPYGRPLFRLG